MEKEIVVRAGLHDRDFAPVSFPVAKELKKAKLTDVENGEEVPSQIEGDLLSWIVGDLEAGEEKQCLITDEDGGAFPGVEMQRREQTVDVKINDDLLTTYHFGKGVVRPFLNPLIGPTGDSVLRELFDRPEPPDHDHIHHRGVLVAHGDINGVDNWSEEEGHGFTRHVSFREVFSGPVYGKIVAENSWVSEKDERVLTEIRTMKFYNISEVRMIDLEIVFESGKEDVTFGDTKEGGILSVRVTTPMRADRKGRIENGYGGINEKETWGKRAPWCDYSGALDSGTVGIAVLDHPDNFRYPTYWHVRDYGLMTANPFALSYYYDDKSRDGSHTLQAGERLKFSYRVYVHRADAKEGGVTGAFHNYINPPEVGEAEAVHIG